MDTKIEMQEATVVKKSEETFYLEEVLSKKSEEVLALIERLPGIASLIIRRAQDSYADYCIRE